MKKIKLIMPILGLSTLASGLVPLTSCGGKQTYTKVTEAEWKKAIDYVCGYGDELPTFHFGEANDHIMLEGVVCKDATFDKGKTKVYLGRSEPGYQYTEPMSNGIILRKDIDGQYGFSTISDDVILIVFNTYFYFIYNDMSDFSCNSKTNEYTASGDIEIAEGLVFKDVKSTVRFNSSKQVSYFKTSFKEVAEGTVISQQEAEIHFDYSPKAVNLPADFTEIKKTHCFKMDTNSKNFNFVDLGLKGKEPRQVCVELTNIPNSTTKISAYEGSTPVEGFYMRENVAKNGTGLEYRKDFTLGDNGEKIVFTEPLKSTDKVTFTFDITQQLEEQTPKTYTLKLE